MARSSPGAVDRRRFLAFGAGMAMLTASARGACAAGREGPLKVAAIYTAPVDQPWVSRVHKALKAAEARGDITYIFSENVGEAEYERVMRQYSREGADLIVGEAFAVEQPARQVAADHPDIAYLMGSSLGPTAPNFAVFDSSIDESSFLAGMIAGRMTRSNVIGLVGGPAVGAANRVMQAFIASAQAVNPQAKFIVTFIDAWSDAPKAREAVLAQIDKGADVLYTRHAGVAEIARERQVKVIGHLIDLSGAYPGTVLASALWHMEPTVNHALGAVIEGTFNAADYGVYSDIAHGGASLSVLDPKVVPPDVIEMVQLKEQEIKDVLFRVPVNEAAPESTL